MKIDAAKHWKASRDDYQDRLLGLIESYPRPDVLELGGGRRPSFALSDMPDNMESYTVNDISENELALLPPGYHKACFDVSGDASAFAGRYDVVFSRFLAEHVGDGPALHRNVWQVLKPGGVAFHLIPTLYASPFVVNRLLPEVATGKMLTKFFPSRKSKLPKFPAFYSMCYGDTERMRKAFVDIGYSKVEIREFYGHFYYDAIPGLRQLEGFVSALAAKNGWSWYASYAFITAYK